MANIQHNSLTGTNLHMPGYVQDTDPGAIGAGKLWIDTSGGTGMWVTKIRNATDTGWEDAGGGGSAVSGYSGFSGFSGGGGGGSSNTYSVAVTNGDLVSGVATITHGLNSRTPLVAVWDNDFKLTLPDEVTSTGVNTLTVDLSGYGPITGTWYVRVTV